jgi:hypothetical protein
VERIILIYHARKKKQPAKKITFSRFRSVFQVSVTTHNHVPAPDPGPGLPTVGVSCE